MNEPNALLLMRTRAVVAEELRRLLPRMEGFRTTVQSFSLGVSALDSHLPQGGLASGALHEVVPADGGTAAAFGFIAALLTTILPRKAGEDEKTHPIFLVLPAFGLRECGRLSGHGLSSLGLDPARLILIETAHRKQTLWAMEEALRSRAPAAVAGLIDKLDLKSSQRLHLAATEAGLPLFLLRPAQTLESSAAATRWRIGTAEAARDRFGLFVRPRWHLQLERCRNGQPGEWVVEYDHVAHRFSLAAALADPACACSASEKSVRQAG